MKQFFILPIVTLVALAANATEPEKETTEAWFEQKVQPILSEYCYGCHGDGANEGSVSLDTLAALEDANLRKETWHRALKQLHADLMPPREEDQPSAEQQATIEEWIKFGALELDAKHPDPGKVTIRRLNRTEYQNTIRDLLGIEFDAQNFFPADDTGHGFDNIGDVLSMSPLLFEKYVDAAKEVISQAVPTASAVMREQVLLGSKFKLDPKETPAEEPPVADSDAAEPTGRGRDRLFGPGFGRRGGGMRDENSPLELLYYEDQTARATIDLEYPGNYQLIVDLKAAETYVDNVFDLNKCEFTFLLDGETQMTREFVRLGGKQFEFKFDRKLESGSHELVFAVKPLSKEEQVRRLRLEIKSVNFVGPGSPETFVKPERYDLVFPRRVPEDADGKRMYAQEMLAEFAAKAFRRPVDGGTVERLVDLAEQVYSSGDTFEMGIAKAMTAILASPRFLFREEFAEQESLNPDAIAEEKSEAIHPLIDEYSLASRLSYFLWSTMPDEELIGLASEGRLREHLPEQLSRMLDDDRTQAMFENFVGQWLRAREIDSVQISARSVLRREAAPDPEGDLRRKRFFELFRKSEEERTEEEAAEFEQLRESFRSSFGRGPRIDLTSNIRRAMRRETEMLFEHIVREDRSLLEILDCDYSFLNAELAQFYGIEGVEGDEMHKVTLPADSPRGGVLTHGTFLAVTSNPDRTSPVKRGLFVLENLLGLSTGAPPPNIPALEDAVGDAEEGKTLSLRETLAIHRQNELCSSCHNRMDPLGLALENFNAMGRFRDQEFGQSIDVAGELLTGESFSNVSELKSILVKSRKTDFYRCLTEKLLTYALGRAIDYNDLITLDSIVQDLENSGGRASVLIRGVINSAAFQRTRSTEPIQLTAR